MGSGPLATSTTYRLFGDVTGDIVTGGNVHNATVSTDDNQAFRPAFNSVFNAPGTTYKAYFDFNGDGDVSTEDNQQFRNRFNRPLTWTT